MKKVLCCIAAFCLGLLIVISMGCKVTSESSIGVGKHKAKSGAGFYVGKGGIKLD